MSEPTDSPLKNEVVLSPVTIAPTTYTTAIFWFLLFLIFCSSPPLSISISFMKPAMPERSSACLLP